MVLGRLIAVALVGVTWPMPGCHRSLECMSLDTSRIAAGESYSHAIGRGLVFRFTAEPGRGAQAEQQVWHITVGPEGPSDRLDYVWPVSPPINSTHHLFVGPGLDWTAADSLGINPRRLHFVLTGRDLKAAERAYAEATRQVVAGSAFDSDALRNLGGGDLTITLRDAAVNEGRIESIRLIVRACVPAT